MPRVFLSYASEDHVIADKIQSSLNYHPSFSIWMDKGSLQGGDDWEREIRSGISQADFFVPLLSRSFLARPRFAQEELAWAMELQRTGKKSDSFVIPARIDDALPDIDALKRVHIIDLIENGRLSLFKLFSAMQVFGSIASRDPAAKIRLTAHQARFRASSKMYYFINVCNVWRDPIFLTHVHYVNVESSIFVQPRSRPMPTRLDVGEAWATWVATDRLPDGSREEAYDKFVVRLGSGEIYRSIKEDSILPEGSVPGGPISLNEKGEDPSA